MVVGMATRKVTVTLDESQLACMPALLWSKELRQVSRATFRTAVSVSLDDVAGWGAMLADAPRQRGKTLTARNEVGRTTSLVLPTIRGVLPPSGWDDP